MAHCNPIVTCMSMSPRVKNAVVVCMQKQAEHQPLNPLEFPQARQFAIGELMNKQ